MDYRDALGRNGWIPDPTDRVTAVAVHAAACPARKGGSCRCQPQIALVPIGEAAPAPAPRRPVRFADTA